MGRIKNRMVFFFILMLCSFDTVIGQNRAQDPPEEELERLEDEFPLIHKRRPKHQGEVIKAGRKYKLEVATNIYKKDEKICIYLRRFGREIEMKDASANAVFKYADGHRDTLRMLLRGNKLVLDSINMKSPANVLFKIERKKKNIAAIYYYPGLK